MNVLFSPLRQREVNPENYDGQVLFWKTQIRNYAKFQENPQIFLSQLKSAFARKDDKPHCLPEVLSAMLSAGEIKPIDQFMQGTNTGWGAWTVQMIRKPLQIGAKLIRDSLFNSSQSTPEVSYVVMDVVNSQADAMIKSLRNQIISKSDIKKRISEWKISEEALPIVLHEISCRQKLVVKHLKNEDDEEESTSSPSHEEDERTVLKFGTETHKAFSFTEMELSIHKLEITERNLLKMIGKMEEQIHEHEEMAKKLLLDKKRVLAKNSLRKRDYTMKRLEKRVNCLENVQTLMQKIHEVTEDAAVLDAYRTGTKSLQNALSKSGITLDTVDEAISKMQDVIELHDEIKSAISTGVAGQSTDDAELEKELEELVAVEDMKEVEEIVKGDAMEKDQEEDELMKQLDQLTIVSDPLPETVSPNKERANDEKEESKRDKEEAMCL